MLASIPGGNVLSVDDCGRIGFDLFRHNAGQQLPGIVGRQHAAGATLEPQNQTDLLRRPSDFIPRQPEAVRVPQGRFAVVFGQLFGREDKFSSRNGVVNFRTGLVEGIHGDGPVDGDRLFGVSLEEHHPPAETADADLSRLIQNRVGPHRGGASGDFRLWRPIDQRQRVSHIEFGATGEQANAGKSDETAPVKDCQEASSRALCLPDRSGVGADAARGRRGEGENRLPENILRPIPVSSRLRVVFRSGTR